MVLVAYSVNPIILTYADGRHVFTSHTFKSGSLNVT